jgi:hypothetical protein
VEWEERWAGVTLAVLTLPDDELPEPDDPRVQLILQPIGRIAVSLRAGRWDDASAQVVPVSHVDLGAVVESFGQQSIYGWDFLDVPDSEGLAGWADRLSLDWYGDPAAMSHSLTLFQEDLTEDRHLDLRIWFAELRIFDANRAEIPFDEFTAGGIRWWDALHAGDERTKGHGIVPAGPS